MIKNARIVSKGTLPEDYFKNEAERGSADFVMSQSALKAFGQCPSRWRCGYNPPVTEAKEYGSLLDCAVMTPEQFDKRYAVAPATYDTIGMQCPGCKTVTDSKKCRNCGCDRVQVKITKDWNWASTFCKEWREDQKGRETITAKEKAECDAAVKRLMDDEILSSFINSSDKQVWVAAEWHDKRTGLVIPIRCLIDLVPRLETEWAMNLADLKTTRTAALMPWQRDCFTFGYFIQGAFNIDLYVAATGEDRNTFCFILQENVAPFEPGRRILSQDFLTLGRAEYTRLLSNYAYCVKNGKWPSYDDSDESLQGWTLISAEPWMAERAAFAPKYDAPPEVPGEDDSFHDEDDITP